MKVIPAAADADPLAPNHIIVDDESHLDRSLIEHHLRAHINRGASEDDCCEDAFFVADMGHVYRQHSRWTRNLGRVKPFYGMSAA